MRFKMILVPILTLALSLTAALSVAGDVPAVGGPAPGLTQCLDIVRGLLQFDRFGRMKAMAVRCVTRCESEHFGRNHILAQQHDEPVCRPDKLNVTGAPAHAFRDR